MRRQKYPLDELFPAGMSSGQSRTPRFNSRTLAFDSSNLTEDLELLVPRRAISGLPGIFSFLLGLEGIDLRFVRLLLCTANA